MPVSASRPSDQYLLMEVKEQIRAFIQASEPVPEYALFSSHSPVLAVASLGRNSACRNKQNCGRKSMMQLVSYEVREVEDAASSLQVQGLCQRLAFTLPDETIRYFDFVKPPRTLSQVTVALRHPSSIQALVNAVSPQDLGAALQSPG
ncbi:hypothetical protein SELMODRAFT_426166 [Selaginella moellendorffii]|uniref:Uncharacterized protein n=1 Tax=Selaginella moellendorffii TaxID=88036 RepID=D8SVI9_SELML|nr:hypothetical protein SELMODRAFT_426166 [Selaginella moellendorffii]